MSSARPYLAAYYLFLFVYWPKPAGCVEWHCASVGAGDGQEGKIQTEEFCFQYYSNVSTTQPSYCCDRSGYYCQRKQFPKFSANHVVQGNFRAGPYTTNTDGSGSNRPTTVMAGICSVDKTRLNSMATPTGIPDCGAGSDDPLAANYCIVMEGKVCLDNGECGVDCGMGQYGGGRSAGGACVLCEKGYWSDHSRAGSPEACSACPHGTYGARSAGCCVWNPQDEESDHPATHCLPCPHGTYSTDAGSAVCKMCPDVCTNGAEEGKYCTTEVDLFTHPPYGELGVSDVERLGGVKFTTTAHNCRRNGGFCNATVTVLDGATHPLFCERYWGPPPDPVTHPPATNAQPCNAAGCGSAFMQFDNHLHVPQHPDSPKDFIV